MSFWVAISLLPIKCVFQKCIRVFVNSGLGTSNEDSLDSVLISDIA